MPSTLDEHVGLRRFYRTSLATEYDPDKEQADDEGMRSYVALVSYVYLSDGAVKAPTSCPSCKLVITGVKRYGRPQNYAMLRVLEQKQIIKTDIKLAEIMSVETLDLDKRWQQLMQLRSDLQDHSPTKVVFEAAAGSELCLVPTPDKTPLLRMLVKLCEVWVARLAAFTSEEKPKVPRFWNKNRSVFDDALAIAVEVNASRRATTVHLLLASALASVWATSDSDRSSQSLLYREARELLEAVLKSSGLSEADREKVVHVERILEAELTQAELQQVVQAMGGGHHTASDASLHWYQCPKGHPYFIGECGGAMQESTCPECGEAVGGGNHSLQSGNVRADDFMRRAGLPGSATHFQ